MKPNEDLFKLVKSLSRSEKRYFKIYASQHVVGRQSNYLRLFDAIDRQEEYDEGALKKRFRKEKFVKHLPSEKNYLFRLIMKSLRAYQRESSVTVNLSELILESDILQQKGLYARSDKVLNKAEKIAREAEQHWVLLEILDRKRKLIKARELKQPREKLAELIDQKNEVMAQLVDRYLYHDRYDELFISVRHKLSATKVALLEELERFFEAQGDQSPRSFSAGVFAHDLEALFHRQRNDRIRSKAAFDAQVRHWEAHPEMCELHPDRYKIALSNYLGACSATDDYAPMPAILEKIRSVPDKTFDIAAENFQNVALWELIYYFNQGNLDAAIALVPKIEKGLETYGEKVNEARRLALWFNISMLYFIADQTSNSLKFIQKIIDSRQQSHRKDIQRAAHCFQMLLHLDLGNFDLLEYLLRAAKRYFKLHATADTATQAIVTLCQQGLRTGQLPLTAPLLEQFLQELPAEGPGTLPGLTELRFWAQARLTGKPTQEVAFHL